MTELVQESWYHVIDCQHISEKATLVADKYRQIVFKVAKNATKIDIKNAVEKIFNVKVEMVQVLNVKPKNKTFKQRPGKRKGWKKAYVTLKDGYDIDFSGAK